MYFNIHCYYYYNYFIITMLILLKIYAYTYICIYIQDAAITLSICVVKHFKKKNCTIAKRKSNNERNHFFSFFHALQKYRKKNIYISTYICI